MRAEQRIRADKGKLQRIRADKRIAATPSHCLSVYPFQSVAALSKFSPNNRSKIPPHRSIPAATHTHPAPQHPASDAPDPAMWGRVLVQVRQRPLLQLRFACPRWIQRRRPAAPPAPAPLPRSLDAVGCCWLLARVGQGKGKVSKVVEGVHSGPSSSDVPKNVAPTLRGCENEGRQRSSRRRVKRL